MTLTIRINLFRLFLGCFLGAVVIHLFWLIHSVGMVPNPFWFDLDLILQIGFLGALGLSLLAALAALNHRRLMAVGVMAGIYYITAWEYLWQVMTELTLQGLFFASIGSFLTGFLLWSLEWGPREDDVPATDPLL